MQMNARLGLFWVVVGVARFSLEITKNFHVTLFFSAFKLAQLSLEAFNSVSVQTKMKPSNYIYIHVYLNLWTHI